MKKFIVIALLCGSQAVSALSIKGLSFAGIQEMLRFSLHHVMRIPMFAEYADYLWEPGDIYFVAINLPDSCSLRQTFPKAEFRDVQFFPDDGDIPEKMKKRAPIFKDQKLYREEAIPNDLYQITYYQEGDLFIISIFGMAIWKEWESGEVHRYGGSTREYKFVFDKTISKWRFEGYHDSGY